MSAYLDRAKRAITASARRTEEAAGADFSPTPVSSPPIADAERPYVINVINVVNRGAAALARPPATGLPSACIWPGCGRPVTGWRPCAEYAGFEEARCASGHPVYRRRRP